MNAYNYAEQKWIHGAEAKAELLRQLNEEKDVLQSPNAAAFLRFTGRKETQAQALELVTKAIAELSQ